jgi:membrane protease YdiL (CAAX protease family)
MSTALPLSRSSPPVLREPSAFRPVAPWWHTALLSAILIGLAVAGAVFQKAATAHPDVARRPSQVVPLYLSLLIMEWGLVLYVQRAGLRRSGTTLRELIGGRWRTWKDVLRDAALAIGLWAVAKLVMSGMERLLARDPAASIGGYLPREAGEVALWVLLSLTAGFVEELVFRGYFQRQFEALTRSPWIALVLQSLLFGVSHGYQGGVACTKIVLLGGMYGLVARWRRSLRPGMITHALTDILGGIFLV